MIKKCIIINNYNDYKIFLRKFKLYKSFLYNNVFFVLENSILDKELEHIIYALNIKRRKKRIEYIYDFCCDLIDDHVKDKNICGFRRGKCYVQRKLKSEKCNGCCRKCKYQSSNGCVTKNLSCKLFNCFEVKLRYNVIKYEDLNILKLFSLKNRIIIKSDYFSKREDVLKDLYSYSLIYSTIRIIYRLIRNIFNNNRKEYIDEDI